MVNDFLNGARLKFKASGIVMIKCGFSLEDIQPAPTEHNIHILNVGYWITEPYKTTFFNDFIFFSFKENFLKTVVSNGMSGSS